jgi:carboxyl-terminal processing protease
MENFNQPDIQNPKISTFSSALKIFFAIGLVGTAFILGHFSGRTGLVFQPKDFKVVNQKDTSQKVDYQLLWEAIKTVDEKFIDAPTDPQKILYGAVKGAVKASGDSYTEFFPPKELSDFKTQLKGSFGGIGAEVGKKNGQIVIIAPLDDSPAKKAGILAQDIVVMVDGVLTTDWSIEEAVEKIRGEKGTKVTLSIYREGRPKPFDLEIVRDEIKIKSVKLEFKETNGKKVAIISLTRFGDDTFELFNKTVGEVLRSSVSGIVLDLRNNPGGYLNSAVEVASNWVKDGEVIVTEAKSKGVPEVFRAEGKSRLASIPTIVLINGGSASASEILAGALQDYGISKLIGEKSFGKGSVQELVDLKGGGAVKVTVAKWITPKGKNLNKDGLVPDIEVKLTEEDIKNAKDTQMEKALEEVLK